MNFKISRAELRKIAKKANIFSYDDFISDLLKQIDGRDEENAEIYEDELDLISYPESFMICPEPIDFIHHFADSLDVSESEEIFERLKAGLDPKTGEDLNKPFLIETVDTQPKNDYGNIWFNRTTNGINLRPGQVDDDVTRVDRKSVV